MISSELSLVQHNSAASAELAQLTAQFLDLGGSVVVLPGFVQTPRRPAKPYGHAKPKGAPRPPAPPKPKRKPRVERMSVGPVMLERLKALAPRMSKVQAVQETGLSRYMIDRTAAEHGIEFMPHDRCKNLTPSAIDPAVDALNVVRLKAARDQGLARKQAAAELGISRSVVERLIETYQIDYPICPPGKRR